MQFVVRTISMLLSTRARGEADFLTSRALKLAQDNDEVKKLRDEVFPITGTEGELTPKLRRSEISHPFR